MPNSPSTIHLQLPDLLRKHLQSMYNIDPESTFPKIQHRGHRLTKIMAVDRGYSDQLNNMKKLLRAKR